MAEERLSRAIEITHLSSPVTRSHVHGVEDRIGTRFWARGSDPELEEETDEESEQEDNYESVSSPEFIRRAMELGFTVPELLQAENEMPSPTSQVPIVEGSIVAKILNTMVKHASSKPARRPWRGPLPPPRVSPKQTLGDAIEAATVCPDSSSRSWISGSSPTASTGRSRRSPEMAQVNNSRSLFFGSGHSRKFSKFKNNPILGSGVGPSDLDFPFQACTKRMGCQILILGPDVPYRPTAGLVSLFARTGTGGKNPRAPHARSRFVAASSYVEVAR